MKKIILLFFLLPALLMAQGEAKPGNVSMPNLPFISGNDTLTASATLTSSTMYAGRFIGAISAGFDFTLLGDSASYIDVYFKAQVGGLGLGVPYDSLGVDSLYLGRVDSAYVADSDPFWFDLAGMDWWSFIDDFVLILVAPADLDSVYVKCRVRGQ